MCDAGSTDTQDSVIAFLLRPDSHGGDVGCVRRIDTHISVVFLAGDRAYKMKRAVRFDYLDYGSLARRRECCEAEVAINRRGAPTLYLGVVAVTREADGRLCLGGAGPAVEWLVEMRRFDQDALLDRMANADLLTPELMAALADSIAGYHAAAAADAGRTGSAIVQAVLDGNFAEIGKSSPALFPAARVSWLEEHAAAALRSVGGLLDDRAAAGRVRHCHGDLHLGNICLVDGDPVLFDAIEFNPDISVIDVLYDLAFLLMDLENRGRRDRANEVFNRYFAIGEDVAGLAAMPLFLSCRAAIRAHTTCAAAARQANPATRRAFEGEARAYFDLACSLLAPSRPRMVVIGGLSGTGKSTAARKVAPAIGRAPGALVLRSDAVRKRIAGVAPETHLAASAYTAKATAAVYARLRRDAAQALAGGQSVVVDAVFARPEERAGIESVAIAAGARLDGFWLEAPQATLEARVSARRNDASDADAAVVGRQFGYDIGTIAWHIVDAGASAEKTAQHIEVAMRDGAPENDPG